MSVTDFLFQGSPPPNVTTSGTSTQTLPQFMQDYMSTVLAGATAAGTQPYQAYQGPRIAGFSPQQQQAQQLVGSTVGSWQPGQTAATNYTTAAGNNSPLATAAPYLQQASQSFNDPNVVNSYMNPYVGSVINQGTNLAMQNFNQNVMPQLDAKFTAAGQYGSSAHEREANLDANQLTQNIQQQDQAALSSAYNTAGQLFNTDASRQGALAQTAGQLGAQQGYLQLGAGQQMGALAQAQQGLGLKDAAALDTSGAEQQNLAQQNLTTAYNDFETQRQYPEQQLGFMSQILQQAPQLKDTSTTGSQPLSGAQYGPSPLAQAGSLYGLYQGAVGPNGLFPNAISDLFGGSSSAPSSSSSSPSYSTDVYGNPMGSTDIYGNPSNSGLTSLYGQPQTDIYGNQVGTGGYTPDNSSLSSLFGSS